MNATSLAAPQIRNNVRLRLTRRGRIVVALLVSVVLIAIAAVAGFVLSVPSASAGEVSEMSYVNVVVGEGESLWGIVEEHAPVNTDLRDYILLVQEVNGLESTVIHPGQELALPQS